MDTIRSPAPRLHTALVYRGRRTVPFHDHPFTELVLVEAGEVSVACQDRDHRATPGALYVLPPRVAHDQRHRGPWRTHCVLYSGGEQLLESRARVLDLSADRLARRWIADLVELTTTGDARAGDGLLHSLLTRLGSHDQRDAAAALPSPLTAALEFLTQRLADEVSDEQVARAAGVSVSHLGGLFRAHLGCGPLRHLQGLRLDRAALLLRNPYLTLTEIARQCGYRDVNYFIRHFRRTHGLPPARWRATRWPRSAAPDELRKR